MVEASAADAHMRILRGLASRTLSCGCIVGLYECYDGRVVTIVDYRASACSQPAHRVGAVVAAEGGSPPANGSPHATAA